MRVLRSRIWLVAVVAACTTVAVFLPAMGADDGRDPSAKPGPVPANTEPRAAESPANGWDGDGPAPRTLVHSGDSTIQGGLCVGFDCSSNEPMGFATIKIEENNLRIAAADSSTVSGFPTTDWQIEFNSSSSGGGNYFMVRDCGSGGAAGSVDSTCGGTPMLTIEGGADNESIHVDSSGNQGGNVGFGTANPVVDLHALSGNTPTLRLEQDNSSGFTPQSWDLAGNESNFFIRDVTNGSALPFRIEPGTASNTLYLDNQERIGINTTAPETTLHVRRTDGTAKLLVAEGSGTTAARNMLEIRNNGGSNFSLVNTATGNSWFFTHQNGGAGSFIISSSVTAGAQATLETDGDLVIQGDLTANGVNYPSDRAAKRSFAKVDGAAILEALAALDIQTWSYRNDPGAATHLGPTAQDFHAAFGLGSNDTTISAVDVNGVALAAIQALVAENTDLRARVAALEASVRR